MSSRLLEAMRGVFGARQRPELRTRMRQGLARITGGQVEGRMAPVEGDLRTGECDAWNRTVSSETLYGLRKDIALTMNAMCRDLYEKNKLEGFLQEQEWRTREPLRETAAETFEFPFSTVRGHAQTQAVAV